jgi:DNA-3-methyladenine glycosylase
MGVDLSSNRADLCGSALFIADDGFEAGKILATPRIGVHYAGEWAHAPLRFLLADNPWVSGKGRRPSGTATGTT